MRFEFASAARIIFGPGTCTDVPLIASSLGRRVFLVTDSLERCQPLIDGLNEKGSSVEFFIVSREPDLESVSQAARDALESQCQVIIGSGGGSTIDTGKAAAAMMTNPGNILDYLEVIGSGHILENPPTPFIAIPTTAGTGSEVTRNAVINAPEKRIKASLRSPYLLPKIAVVDPELTYEMPPSITASTGMDALTQLIEPFVSNASNPLTDALCREGIPRVGHSLRTAIVTPRALEARQDMSLASLFGGLALANARLGAVHGMANPIGGMSHAPHGAVCARLLPLVMETNLQALRQRQPDSPALARYAEIGRLLTGDEKASADDGIVWIQHLCQDLDIRPLKEHEMKSEDFPALVDQSQKASSMKGNPVALKDSELMNILIQAF
jgi:alcohol dehydrogenase class IV